MTAASLPSIAKPFAMQRIFSSRPVMGLLMLLALILYLYNAPYAIDYPQFDESNYFFFGYRLLTDPGNPEWSWSPQASPLIFVVYSVFIALLDTSKVFPWLQTFSFVLFGMSAYLLLSRVFHPLLSWVLAVVVVVASVPAVPSNSLYYFSAGLLWLSLSFLGKRPATRGLAAFCVLLSVYARPEFLICLFVLLICLAFYEWRELRRKRVRLVQLMLIYAPVLLGLVVTASIWSQMPDIIAARSSNVLAWSYNEFYRVVYPDQFEGYSSFANPYTLFERDFGAVAERNIVSGAAAFFNNPAKLFEYATFSVSTLWSAYATALFTGFGWKLTPMAQNLFSDPTQRYDALLALLLVGLSVVALASYRRLKRQNRLRDLPLAFEPPLMFAYAAMLPLVIVLIIILPQLRYFQIFPLVLLPVGIALTLIVYALELNRWMVLSFAAAILVLVPQPYTSTTLQPVDSNIQFLRANLHDEDTILGGAITSFTHYLRMEGMDITAVEAATFAEPVVVNAVDTYPTISHVLMNHVYDEQTYQGWQRDWYALYPESPLTVVAGQISPYVQLLSVPDDDVFRARYSYRSYLSRVQASGQTAENVPAADALDFAPQLIWTSDSPAHNLNPNRIEHWNSRIYAIRLGAYHSTLPADIPSQLETELPAAWAGRTLVFLATLAPEILDGRGESDGVVFQMIIEANGQQITTPILLDNLASENWAVLRLDLPRYIGNARLRIVIEPNETTWYDLLHFRFIGVMKDPAGN